MKNFNISTIFQSVLVLALLSITTNSFGQSVPLRPSGGNPIGPQTLTVNAGESLTVGFLNNTKNMVYDCNVSVNSPSVNIWSSTPSGGSLNVQNSTTVDIEITPNHPSMTLYVMFSYFDTKSQSYKSAYIQVDVIEQDN